MRSLESIDMSAITSLQFFCPRILRGKSFEYVHRPLPNYRNGYSRTRTLFTLYLETNSKIEKSRDKHLSSRPVYND